MNLNENTISEEDLLKLSAPVGRTQKNNPMDVAKVEAIMGATGHLDLSVTDGPTGYFGQRLENAVKEFQKEENLEVDGMLNPKGKTISTAGTVVENTKDETNENEKPIKENAMISLFRWLSEKINSPEELIDGPYIGGTRGQK